MKRALAGIVGLVMLQGMAEAGRRPFLYAFDTSMVPEGDVEIETWLDYLERWRFWWGPRWSPANGFEVTALTSFQQNEGGGGAIIWAELVEGRWRGPATALGSLTLELDFRIAIADRLPHQIQPQIGWVKRAGRVVATVQAGYAHGFEGTTPTPDYDWVTWRAGVAFDAIQGEISAPLQIGVETFGEGVIRGANDVATSFDFASMRLRRSGSTANVGPTLSVARGRLWFTGGVLFGVTSDSPDVFARGIIGLAL